MSTWMRGAAIAGIGLAAATAWAGCGGATISQQLHSARAELARARSGPAGRLEPDELLAAERTLERAEAQPDGSTREVHYAYLAERQIRIAEADARRDELQRQIAADERAYRDELAAVARARGQELETVERELAAREQALQAQQQQMQATRATLEAREQELQQEQQARLAAEQRATDAMARLRELALVRQEPTETVITLSGEVLFVTDRAELRPEARDRLLAVADAVRARPDQAIEIEGHTDSRGSDAYNRDLSQRRANAVRDYLVSEGVPLSRIRAIGMGEAQPVASNDSPEGRANNRRVEIILRPIAALEEQTPAPTTPSGGR